MDVITCAELPSVVVAPGKYIVTGVQRSNEAATQLQVSNGMREICLELGLIHATREEWGRLLQESD